ncbi:MAG: hypothetical protein JO180_10875, partial [Gemmatirosa sp.]|nr:hypothetical protein [Gemmatirosa sp.]
MRQDISGAGDSVGPVGELGATSARRLEPEPARRATDAPPGLRMPAEWEPHDATWIAWP